ncbi:YgdI/YgdR family lipoprotein [Serratia rhizosphaerae]|uniref:YgdI/YgdR family lipoprotein n=1 Tax=Serratia rhizosphaerae TaxID=2597702 RepID=A0ABX6GPV9_9GAMM|nr:YgdI/YgdR family lipoprotein [Serratia rhizosphaerae]MEB6336694.1 YgdI/YgdR family lipoprotein [Serratia rhizosphaerae]QHA88250.1 YgdI/YgdR family lipoprotein [Serratia rhizosphaerae]
MKKWVMAAAALAMAVGLTGCSSDYVMATKDGNMILTQGKPEIDKDTGLISYQDEKGNSRQINGDQVSQVIER